MSGWQGNGGTAWMGPQQNEPPNQEQGFGANPQYNQPDPSTMGTGGAMAQGLLSPPGSAGGGYQSGQAGFYGNSTNFNPGGGYFGNYQSSAGAGSIGPGGTSYSIQGGPNGGMLGRRGTFDPSGSREYGGGLAPGQYGTGGPSPVANQLRGMLQSGQISRSAQGAFDEVERQNQANAGYNPVAHNAQYQAQQQYTPSNDPRKAALNAYPGR